MNTKFDPARYKNVPGAPAFPTPSAAREEAYIEKRIREDKEAERRDNTLPRNYCG